MATEAEEDRMTSESDDKLFHPFVNNDDPEEDPPPPPRSIDDFLESAYRHNDIDDIDDDDDGGGGSAIRHRHRRGRPGGGPGRPFLEILQRWRYYVIFLALGIANSGDSAELGYTSYVLGSVDFQRDILTKSGEEATTTTTTTIDFAGRGAAVAGAHFAGMLISGLLSGVLADVWGRRSTLLLGLRCNVVVGLLSVFARNAGELCALRFVLGVGLGMVIAGVVTLCAEVSPPSHRGRFMTLVGACYTLGFLYTSFWALVVFRRRRGEEEDDSGSSSGNWRAFVFANALPTMAAAYLVAAFVPESPRYYLCRGRTRDAARVANDIATRMGHRGRMMTEEELSRAKVGGAGESNYKDDEDATDSRMIVEGTPAADNLRGEVWTSLVGIRQVFANGMYRRTVPLQLSFFALQMATGVMQWMTKIFQTLELPTDAYVLSFLLTLAQIPGMMLASGLIETGRRRLVTIGFGGGFAVLISLSALSNAIQNSEEEEDSTTTADNAGGEGEGGGAHRSAVVLGLSCAYSVFLCMAWLSLDVLSAESFPTRVRSTGRGVCVATGRIGGLLVQFLYGRLMMDRRGRLPYVFGVASAFAVGGLVAARGTTDTTDADLNDRWEYGSEAGCRERRTKRNSLVEAQHMD